MSAEPASASWLPSPDRARSSGATEPLRPVEAVAAVDLTVDDIDRALGGRGARPLSTRRDWQAVRDEFRTRVRSPQPGRSAI